MANETRNNIWQARSVNNMSAESNRFVEAPALTNETLLQAVAGPRMKSQNDYREHSVIEANFLPVRVTSSPTATGYGVLTVFQ